MAAVTSSGANIANSVNATLVGAGRNVGGDDPDVVDRIRFTFMKVDRSSAETPSQARCPRPSSRSTMDHMSRELVADVNLSDQNEAHFRLHS